MKITTRNAIVIVSAIFLAITSIKVLPAIYTTKELISGENAPKEYFIDTAADPIEQQEDGQCSAYAAAYVMRYLGDDIHGYDLYLDIDTDFGEDTPANVVKLFKEYEYQAKAYHGDLNTMKERLSEGTPLIIYLRERNDTHYAVITGYDEEHLYLADSITEYANADNPSYNRIIDKDEFLNMWKTGFWICDNVYITASKKR